MQTLISVRLYPTGREFQGFRTSTHSGVEGVYTKISLVSWQKLEDLEITYQMANGSNNHETLLNEQRRMRALDLTPLEGKRDLPLSLSLLSIDFSHASTLYNTITNTYLVSLSLLSCFLTDDFLVNFSRYLKTNTHIKSINFSSNRFTPKGCRALIETLAVNKNVKDVILLDVCTADDETLNGWPELLKNSTTLKVVHLGVVLTGKKSWVAPFCEVIESNKILKEIILHGAFQIPSETLGVRETMAIFRAALKNEKLNIEIGDSLLDPESSNYLVSQ